MTAKGDARACAALSRAALNRLFSVLFNLAATIAA
jgi:hypothetical protein